MNTSSLATPLVRPPIAPGILIDQGTAEDAVEILRRAREAQPVAAELEVEVGRRAARGTVLGRGERGHARRLAGVRVVERVSCGAGHRGGVRPGTASGTAGARVA